MSKQVRLVPRRQGPGLSPRPRLVSLLPRKRQASSAARRPGPGRRATARRPDQRPARSRRPCGPELRADRHSRSCGGAGWSTTSRCSAPPSRPSTATARRPTTCSASWRPGPFATPPSSTPATPRSSSATCAALRVSPNGHANTAKRPLLDKGLRYVLECCRALFNYAAKRRHLSPYAENPFRALEIDRIPIQESPPHRPVHGRAGAGLPGGVRRLAVPPVPDPAADGAAAGGVDPPAVARRPRPDDGLLRVRNKPRLGWQVKTRNERDIPLVPVLAEVLRVHLRGRTHGPVVPAPPGGVARRRLPGAADAVRAGKGTAAARRGARGRRGAGR